MPEDSTVITLRGSTDIVKEFFEYSVNTILYQRGIYPPESFKRVSKYGLAMMVTTDDALIEYISNIMNQLQGIYLQCGILCEMSCADPSPHHRRLACQRRSAEAHLGHQGSGVE